MPRSGLEFFSVFSVVLRDLRVPFLPYFSLSPRLKRGEGRAGGDSSSFVLLPERAPSALRPLPADARPLTTRTNRPNSSPMHPISTPDHARPAVPFAAAAGGILLFTTVDAI